MFVIIFRSLSFQWALINFSSRPGPGLSEFDFNLRGRCLESRFNHYMVSEASQVVRGPSIHVSCH